MAKGVEELGKQLDALQARVVAAAEENKRLRERAETAVTTAAGTAERAESFNAQGASGGNGGGLHFNSDRYSNRIPPKIPNDPGKVVSWLRRMQLFLESEGLEHTISSNPTCPVYVIGCKDRVFLVSIHGEKLVADHQKAWGYLLEATCNTEIKEKLVACSCVPEVWGVIQGWSLPTSDAEKALLVGQLETIQMFPGEGPKLFLARVDKLVNTMRVIGIEKSEGEIVQITVRQLSDDYDVEKRSSLSSSGITRVFVEHTIRTSYANRKVKELRKPQLHSAAAPPPRDPHALAVGGFRQSRGGGGGGQRRDGSGFPGGGVEQQQLWAHGGVVQQPQQHGSWNRQHQPQFPVQRQQKQQHYPRHQQHGSPHRQQRFRPSLQHPHQRGGPKSGPGGPWDCGKNATWYQDESPVPANAPMGAVPKCS